MHADKMITVRVQYKVESVLKQIKTTALLCLYIIIIGCVKSFV